MERYGMACNGKLFWTWAAYAYGVTLLSQVVAAAHVPAIVAWLAAAAVGAAVLGATEGL